MSIKCRKNIKQISNSDPTKMRWGKVQKRQWQYKRIDSFVIHLVLNVTRRDLTFQTTVDTNNVFHIFIAIIFWKSKTNSIIRRRGGEEALNIAMDIQSELTALQSNYTSGNCICICICNCISTLICICVNIEYL